MQASSRSLDWTAPQGTLGELTRDAYERAALAASRLDELRDASRDLDAPPSFRDALRREHVAIIAEVKRSSPSKGAIAPQLDAGEQATAYVKGGAAAISVLTEPVRFGGSLDDLVQVAAHVGVPALRKDFIVEPVQLWEARAAGAAAALVIVRALEPERLVRLADTARETGIELLFEVRNEAELERAFACNAQVIGVNNRNLETLVIDATTAPTLIPRIPSDIVAVAESGISSPGDALAAVDAGADALLVGSAVSASLDPASAVTALAGFRRQSRT